MRTVNIDINTAEEKAARRAYHRSHWDCHAVCAVITLAFLALGVFAFFGSVGRIIEAGRDFGLSVAYYFCRIFGIPNAITPTVNDYPKIPFFDFMAARKPLPFLFPTIGKALRKIGRHIGSYGQAAKTSFRTCLSSVGCLPFCHKCCLSLFPLFCLRIFFSAGC